MKRIKQIKHIKEIKQTKQKLKKTSKETLSHINTKSGSHSNVRLAVCLSLCFILPALILIFVYYSYGIAPFGDKSLLIMDMSAQYSEFFCGLKHISTQNGGILFSWSKVFGGNYAGVFAYYLSSPLSILTLLCPNEYMPVGLMWLTVIKIGLSGLTFGILMCKMHQNMLNAKTKTALNTSTAYTTSTASTASIAQNAQSVEECQSSPLLIRSRLYIPAFAVFYALMSYNIVYSMCLMWLDAVIWLPIIIIGIEKIAAGGKPYLLFAAFSALFISTYYISYMVGIFTCIYIIFALMRNLEADKIKLKNIPSALIKFIASAAAAACMGAWLLLPTLNSLFEGKISGSFLENMSDTVKMSGVNYEPEQILKKFFLGTYDSITNSGTPFVYCGIIIAALYFTFYFTKTITKSDKIMTLTITVMLGLSTYYINVDTMWHVFQRPNWFPYRYLFIFTFFVIFTAARAFMRLKEIPYAVYATFFIMAGAFYAYILKLPENGVGEQQKELTLKALIAALIILTLAALISRMKKTKATAIVLCTALCCLSAWETYQNARLLTEGLDNAHRYESYEKYTDYKKLTQTLANSAETLSEGEFYRMGACFQRNFNESIGLGYAGISHYSSSYNSSINTFLKKMGFAQIYFWSSYAGSTTVTDSLFSVKYVMSDPDISRYDDKGRVISWSKVPFGHYNAVAQKESAVLYENPYALPPCIAVNPDIKGFDFAENAVESQDRLLRQMTGETESYFVKITENSEGAVTFSSSRDNARYILTAPADGPLYAVLPANGNRTAYMKINENYEIKLYTGETDCVQFLGSYSAGESIEISIDGYDLNTDGNTFYQLNIEKFKNTVNRLKENAINISKWSSGYIKGTLTADKDGCAFTSLVYDDSWNVFVDGKKTDTWAMKDGLLCFDIDAGAHEIEIEYSAPGSAAGAAVTICFIVGAAAYYIIMYVIARRKSVC